MNTAFDISMEAFQYLIITIVGKKSACFVMDHASTRNLKYKKIGSVQ